MADELVFRCVTNSEDMCTLKVLDDFDDLDPVLVLSVSNAARGPGAEWNVIHLSREQVLGLVSDLYDILEYGLGAEVGRS